MLRRGDGGALGAARVDSRAVGVCACTKAKMGDKAHQPSSAPAASFSTAFVIGDTFTSLNASKAKPISRRTFEVCCAVSAENFDECGPCWRALLLAQAGDPDVGQYRLVPETPNLQIRKLEWHLE